MPPKSNRIHRQMFFLNDEELAWFKLEVKYSKLSTPNFIRHRCLSQTKHKQVPLSSIELYQKLGALQQQMEHLIQQVPTDGGGDGRGNRNGDSSRGDGKDGRNGQALVQSLLAHLEAIKHLRAEVVMLEQDTPGQDSNAGR